jgi:hypothetical protein
VSAAAGLRGCGSQRSAAKGSRGGEDGELLHKELYCAGCKRIGLLHRSIRVCVATGSATRQQKAASKDGLACRGDSRCRCFDAAGQFSSYFKTRQRYSGQGEQAQSHSSCEVGPQLRRQRGQELMRWSVAHQAWGFLNGG